MVYGNENRPKGRLGLRLHLPWPGGFPGLCSCAREVPCGRTQGLPRLTHQAGFPLSHRGCWPHYPSPTSLLSCLLPWAVRWVCQGSGHKGSGGSLQMKPASSLPPPPSKPPDRCTFLPTAPSPLEGLSPRKATHSPTPN